MNFFPPASLRRAISGLFIATQLSLSLAAEPALAPPRHLDLAEQLLRDVALENTSYKHQEPMVAWKGDGDASCSHADCSGFVDACLSRAYPQVDAEFFRNWLGKKRPLARDYYDAIVQRKYFQPIDHITATQPGDIIAVKYAPGGENTGHVMLVASLPSRTTPKQPLVVGAEQWEVPVIDSSMSGHGPADTRRQADGTFRNGLGRGVLRIYSSPTGEITGYAWSMFAKSEFHAQTDRALAIGRLELPLIAR